MSYERKSHQWTLLFSVAGVLLLGGGLGAWWWKSAGYVSTDDARIKAEIVSVSADITGRIDVLSKDEGDAVAAGEVMARLDDREVLIQIQQAEAAVDRSRSRLLEVKREVGFHGEKHKGQMAQAEATLRAYHHNLEDARAHWEKAKDDWQRGKALFERDLISQQELSRVHTEFRQAEARFSALQEKVKEG